MPAHCFFDRSRATAEQHWQCSTIDVALLTAIVYFFFDFATPLVGFANADVTVDTAGPALFFAVVFLGFLGSRFDLCWPLAISASFSVA